jgi:hypothetical protein
MDVLLCLLDIYSINHLRVNPRYVTPIVYAFNGLFLSCFYIDMIAYIWRPFYFFKRSGKEKVIRHFSLTMDRKC